ncbi:DUF603 domain-containing protein [Borreliella burgdorferi]|uniref:Uncharacterized protein n=3 Tax=Borreliella burgdorferi TaxID=139 RepID=A0A7U3YAR0_BORBG|nr:DUF603 domain-containing protein [Borreliella burgdorferi]ACM10117.1 conserved hypothetical protein [Borreliella burgdorferi 72a]ACM10191.1 conserved hypothetical protein [Borreliella burgdorferi 72a]ACN92612.1 conserved hypothetical protein [Borreliella burgdorferi 118a]ACN93216.1 conserved hypothetical protein [Borreliella burgdorferi 118a]ADQ30114.1 hypothetical protein BbuN40_Q45 [Borreliella burgdorferi N40]
MKRAKRSFDDYAAYFSEGSLSDVEIAKKLGVSKVNVWRMRQKWESGESSVNQDSRVTISEDTFEHLLSQTFRSEVNARKVRSELDLERANLELGFINAFKQYSSVELVSMYTKIENLRAEIDALNKASNKKNKQVVNGEINSLKSELDEYIKECSIREMELYYECMKKLATANEAESKSNYKNSKGHK